MKKLIRRKLWQDFAAEEGGWTRDITLAQQFPNLLTISDEVRAQYAPHEVELYYAFGDYGPSEYDFCQGCLAIPQE